MIDEKKLIEEVAEEIENCYGRETELSNKAREYLIQPKKIGEWISCSERLPEMCKPVLATYHRECDNFDKVLTAYLEQDGEWRIEFGGSCGFESVIAWQPLPVPYEVKSDE